MPEDVLKEAFAGIVGIWFIEDENEDLIGVAVAGPQQLPQARWLKISFVAGKRLVEWWPLFVDEMSDVARKAGCSKIYAYGRPGWVRFWKQRKVAVHVASECLIREL